VIMIFFCWSSIVFLRDTRSLDGRRTLSCLAWFAVFCLFFFLPCDPLKGGCAGVVYRGLSYSLVRFSVVRGILLLFPSSGLWFIYLWLYETIFLLLLDAISSNYLTLFIYFVSNACARGWVVRRSTLTRAVYI
jgi:hypothetical protein